MEARVNACCKVVTSAPRWPRLGRVGVVVVVSVVVVSVVVVALPSTMPRAMAVVISTMPVAGSPRPV